MDHGPVLNAAQIRTGHNSHVHNGNVYGDIYNTRVYETDDRAEILKSLRYDGMDGHRYRPLCSYGDTYEWILKDGMADQACSNHEEVFTASGLYSDDVDRLRAGDHRRRMASDFQSWLSLPKPMFWISGKPGSGKSTLMKFLAEKNGTARLLRQWGGENVQIHSFYFWHAGRPLEMSQEGLMRSLLHQILQSQPLLIDRHVLVARRWQLRLPDCRLLWTSKELRNLLFTILHDPANTLRYCFFIDGLDECSEDHEDLVDLLRELHGTERVKICISSREWTIFEDTFGRRHTGLHIRLQDVNQADIDRFLRGKFEEHPRFKAMLVNDDGATQLLEDIRRLAQGVFLWIFLVTRELRAGLVKQDTIPVLQRRLEAVPTELNDYIDRIFDDIESYYRPTAARTILLLNHCIQTGASFHIFWAVLIEQDSENSGFAIDAPVQRLASDQVQRYFKDAHLSLQRWGYDVLSIVPREEIEAVLHNASQSDFAHLAVAATPPHCHSMGVTYSHSSLFDYFEHKNLDGSLSRLAGVDYAPILTLIRITLRMAKVTPFDPYRALKTVRYLARCIPTTKDRALAAEFTSLLLEIDRIWQSSLQAPESPLWHFHGVLDPRGWPLLHGTERRVVYTSSLYMNFGCRLLINEILDSQDLSKAAYYALIESSFYPRLRVEQAPSVGRTSGERSPGAQEHSPGEIHLFPGLSGGTFQLFPLPVAHILLRSPPLGCIVDVNEPILRYDGTSISLWQRYVSMLRDETTGVHSRAEYDPTAALELLKLLLRLGADPEAPVSLLKWSDTLSDFQNVVYPAGLTFVTMDSRDEHSESWSDELSQSTHQVTCSENGSEEPFASTDQITRDNFNQRVEQLLHEAYIASTSNPVASGTCETDTD